MTAPSTELPVSPESVSLHATAPATASSEKGTAQQVDDLLNAAMDAYLAGDGDAFETLYNGLRRPIGRYLQSMALDAGLAEDLLQETFLQIHRSRHTYLGPRVQAWAFGIARYVFLMARRSRIRRRRHEVVADDDLPDIPCSGTVWQSFAEQDSLRRAIARLSETRREPLLLHHVWGFSFREIGGILGIREGTAKVRSHRGLADLRQILGVDHV